MRGRTAAARAVAWLAAAGLAVACSSGGSTRGTASPSGASGSSKLPRVWAGVQEDGDQLRVTVADTGSAPRRVAARPRSPSGRRDVTLSATDLVYDPATASAYIGTCCGEPSGTIFRVQRDAARPALTAFDAGVRLDLAGTPPVMARTDSSGSAAVGTPKATEALAGVAAAADVALRPGRTLRLAALLDPRRFVPVSGLAPSAGQSVVVRERGARGAWTDVATVQLPPDRRYCSVIWLGPDRVGLLEGAVAAADPLRCDGRSLDVYNVGIRRLDVDTLEFEQPVRHLSVDDSCTFVIYTAASGAVRWKSLDGGSGDLAASGFAAADW